MAIGYFFKGIFLLVVIKFNEACVLDAIRLRISDWKDDTLAQLFVRPEDHFDIIPMGHGCAASNFWNRRQTSGRIDGYAAIRCDGAGSERKR